MFKRVLLTSVSAVVLSASAYAADLSRSAPVSYKDTYVPVQTWSGFYLGVNGGYAWSADNTAIDATIDGTKYLNVGTFRPEGAFGGGQIGYNLQGALHPNLVLGVEADFQGADINDKISYTDLGSTSSITAEKSLNWFGTVRGRIGYASGSALIYATGGLAYGEVEYKLDGTVLRDKPVSYDTKSTQTGYVVGGGLEYMVTPRWSAKAEYQYIDLGKEALSGSVSGATYSTNDLSNSFHTVRLGLNYHVGSTYEPLK